jgi:probable rRNA maturation factor
MEKEKRIKISYITYIKKHYIPSSRIIKKWILVSLMKDVLTHVNIIFVGHQRIRTLNKIYLNNDHATNVLTFPNNDKNTSSGDIILCPKIINQEAKQFGLPLKLRWAHMIIHSMLHLQGYTHNVTRNRLKMEKLEVKLLTDMNYGNPYVRI